MAKMPDMSFFGKTRELLYLQSYIKINDNSSALVENCRQILECTDVCVRLLTSRFEIEIWGSTGTIHTGRIFTAPDGYEPRLTIKHNQDIHEQTLAPDNSFRNSMHHFINCTEDEDVRIDTIDGIETQAKTMDQVVRKATAYGCKQ